MAQSGHTPIILYSSTNTGNVPAAADLATGELALNAADGKLFYKNSTTNNVTQLAGLSGYSGISGYSGYSGGTGTNGTSGYSGYSGGTGSNGASGYSGYSGGTGTNGTSGYSGYSGSGISGYSGLGLSGYSGYSGVAPNATYVRTSFTATGGQTTFSATYTVGYVEVYLNGVFLNGSDYTATNGTSVVLSVAAASGDIVETIAYNTVNVAAISTSTANTWTGTQTFNGTSSTLATVLLDAAETVNVVAAAPSSTTNFYVNSGSVQYYTTNAANNWTLNIAFSSGTSLNTAMSTGQSVSIAMLATQGATPYYNSAVTIDGTSVTPKWQGGTAPSAGNASGVDTYTYTIVKTASATYTVLASLTQFK